MRKSHIYILFGVCLALGTASVAEDSRLSLSVQEGWSNVFADTQITFHVGLISQEDISGKLGWRLSAEGRTIQRGEQAVKISSAQPAIVELAFKVPQVKAGVVQQLSLEAAFNGDNHKTAEVSKILWVFTDDPFLDKQDWLKSLNIHLFDPEAKTAERLTDEGISFALVKSVDAFKGIRGVLLIGEGVSFKEYKGLGPAIVGAVASGVSVLCLDPLGGEMLLPGMGEEPASERPAMISLYGNEIIRKLDKRLDSEAWAPDGKITRGTIKIVGERGPVAAVFSEEDSGWSLIELRFGPDMIDENSPGPAKLVICSFGVIEKWESGPAPRFLFERLLKYVDSEEQHKKERTK